MEEHTNEKKSEKHINNDKVSTPFFVMTTTKKLLIVSFTIVAIIAIIYSEINEYRDRKEPEITQQTNSIDDMFYYYVDGGIKEGENNE